MKFAPAVAYHFCLALPVVFTQPGARILAELCTGNIQELEQNLRYLFAEQTSVVYVKMFMDAKVSFC